MLFFTLLAPKNTPAQGKYKHMIFLIFFFLLFSTNCLPSTHCLRQELVYEPFMIPNDPVTEEKRLLLEDINSDMKVIRNATPDEAKRKCLYFALKRTTGFTGSCPFNLGPIVLEKYWRQTVYVKPKDIAVYLEGSKSVFPRHYAAVVEVVTTKNEILYILESKLGEWPYIIGHEARNIAKSCGNAIVFFTPKDIYSSDRERLALLMEKELTNPYEEKASDDHETDVFLTVFYAGALIASVVSSLI